MTNRGVTELEDICCYSHEKADTRIFAHIASCSEINSFVIHMTNTEIVMLAMYHFPRLPHVRVVGGKEQPVLACTSLGQPACREG